MAKCSSQVDECLADSTCAGGKACVEGCECGDMTCLLECATKHVSDKGDKLSSCVNHNCQPPPGPTPPSCAKVGCPTACECTMAKCNSQVDECLADSTCAVGRACVEGCKCGNMTCLLDCATKHA